MPEPTAVPGLGRPRADSARWRARLRFGIRPAAARAFRFPLSLDELRRIAARERQRVRRLLGPLRRPGHPVLVRQIGARRRLRRRLVDSRLHEDEPQRFVLFVVGGDDGFGHAHRRVATSHCGAVSSTITIAMWTMIEMRIALAPRDGAAHRRDVRTVVLEIEVHQVVSQYISGNFQGQLVSWRVEFSRASCGRIPVQLANSLTLQLSNFLLFSFSARGTGRRCRSSAAAPTPRRIRRGEAADANSAGDRKGANRGGQVVVGRVVTRDQPPQPRQDVLEVGHVQRPNQRRRRHGELEDREAPAWNEHAQHFPARRRRDPPRSGCRTRPSRRRPIRRESAPASRPRAPGERGRRGSRRRSLSRPTASIAPAKSTPTTCAPRPGWPVRSAIARSPVPVHRSSTRSDPVRRRLRTACLRQWRSIPALRK